jgi:RHS repeat-associated protein
LCKSANQLNHVADGVPKGNYTTDIDNEVANNYTYDKQGNMIFDSSQHLTITWNVRNKVATVKNDSTHLFIIFGYDAMGNRVMKKDSNLSTHTSYTIWYLRDAQGNILSTYKEKNDSLYWQECDIYGSSRVGVYYLDSLIYPKGYQVKRDSLYTMQMWEGKKQYELTNHLGNVLTTVSDKILPAADSVKLTGADSYDTVKSYRAEIISVNDLYPFGMVENGRNFHLTNDSDYHFGFNGQWKDNDIQGNGNSMDFGDRMNDTRLGRWMSTDPLFTRYPDLSPYSFVNNSPLNAVDAQGNDIIVLNVPGGAGNYGHTAILVGNDKTGWDFVSKEGRDHNGPWYSNEATGGPSIHFKQHFNSLQAFKEAQQTDKRYMRYTESVRFTTTPEQDKAAFNASLEAAKSWYQFYYKNCVDAVSAGLSAAGLDPGYTTFGYSVDDNPFSTGDPIKRLDPIPNHRFAEMKANNSKLIVPTFPSASNSDNSTLIKTSTTSNGQSENTTSSGTYTSGGNSSDNGGMIVNGSSENGNDDNSVGRGLTSSNDGNMTMSDLQNEIKDEMNNTSINDTEGEGSIGNDNNGQSDESGGNDGGGSDSDNEDY